MHQSIFSTVVHFHFYPPRRAVFCVGICARIDILFRWNAFAVSRTMQILPRLNFAYLFNHYVEYYYHYFQFHRHRIDQD